MGIMRAPDTAELRGRALFLACSHSFTLEGGWLRGLLGAGCPAPDRSVVCQGQEAPLLCGEASWHPLLPAPLTGPPHPLGKSQSECSAGNSAQLVPRGRGKWLAELFELPLWALSWFPNGLPSTQPLG